jgi:ABC-type transport system substrate-binding protein
MDSVRRNPLRTLVMCVCLSLLCFPLVACKVKQHKGKKALYIPVQANVGTLDPMLSDSMYDSWSSAVVTEPLLQYHYLKRPLELQPLLLKTMPTVSKDGLTYTFVLKKGIYFHDDPCFPGGKGRELVSKDVLYSIKRMANRAHKPSPRGWWVYEGRIVGLDAFRAAQYKRVTKQNKPFNVDAPVEGLKVLSRYQFQIKLVKPFPQLLYLLAFQKTAVVPREAVEYYGSKNRGGFSQHPVGTGPFQFVRWRKGVNITYKRNPKYWHSTYPKAGFSKQNVAAGLAKDAGAKLPFADILVVQMYQQYQPSWLKFRVGDLHFVTVGAEYWDLVYTPDLKLREVFRRNKISTNFVKLLDFIYIGFNFRDPVVGGYGKKKIYLRKALRYAYDLQEINRRFYNNRVGMYTGVIPPGLEGHNPTIPRPNLKLARYYLAKAGYPNGQGLPVLRISTNISNQSKEREDVIKRQFARIGVRVKYDLSTFPQLSRKLRAGSVQMFSLAWGSDYPDAENNLMLFYGPNSAPGPNSWNFDYPLYNKLYEKVRVMSPSPARTALYKKMNQLLIDQVASLGSMARTRYYLKNPTLKNCRPDETITTFWKYLKVPTVK